MRLSYIATPSVPIPSSSVIHAFLHLPSPKKSNQKSSRANRLFHKPSFWLGFMAICILLSILKLVLVWRPLEELNSCSSVLSLAHSTSSSLDRGLDSSAERLRGNAHAASQINSDRRNSVHVDGVDFIRPLPPHALTQAMAESEKDFWKQPDGQGFTPCLNFLSAYGEESKRIAKRKKNYLLVIVSGGLNQQRNQIVDAVVIARILGASLVVPILQVNQIWQDESEFADIFDVEHFKRVLREDVVVVSSLPSTHIMTRPVEERRTPMNASPHWFRSHYLKKLNREGVLLLRGMDGRLSKDLSPDLQKLRCKVAFHALRFIAPIMEMGSRLARRMWENGPYVALHLRLEKDVWVRSGCLPGLGPEFDEEILQARIENPELLTGRSNMSYEERRLAGLCPLNALEIVRLLKGLGASRDTRIFWAGGEPLGGDAALKPLIEGFAHVYNKYDLAYPGELDAFKSKASSLAAVDYLISLHSDVFMPSHGGNMARALQGHRAYAGFRKHIIPNKREMLPYFFNATLTGTELDAIIKDLHSESLGQPAFRRDKKGRDVLAYPALECMCNGTSIISNHEIHSSSGIW